MTLDEAERQAHEALDALRHEYELRAKPFMDQLVRIHNMRPPAPFFVTPEQLAASYVVPFTNIDKLGRGDHNPPIGSLATAIEKLAPAPGVRKPRLFITHDAEIIEMFGGAEFVPLADYATVCSAATAKDAAVCGISISRVLEGLRAGMNTPLDSIGIRNMVGVEPEAVRLAIELLEKPTVATAK